MRWAIVVLNWNGREDTLTCLQSLRELDREVDVICVDNGSSDGSPSAIRKRFPEVELIETGANLGFSGGNNRGIEAALERGADWVVLLNNDATPAPDVIDAFERVIAQRPRAGALAGKLFFADDPELIWFAGQRFHARLGYSGRPRGYRHRDAARYSKVAPTDRAAGALMAVSREALQRCGPLDDELFAYVEDVEWSLRIREGGFEVLLVPEARAWHRVAGSTGGEQATDHALYYGTRNTIVVCERRAPLPGPLTMLRRLLIAASTIGFALVGQRRWSAIEAVVEGYQDARRGRLGGPWRPRRRGRSASARS